MKCMVTGCKSEIDELKEFPVTFSPKGEREYDEAGQRAHAAALEEWTFFTIHRRVAHFDDPIETGHICSGHDGAKFGLTVEKGA